MHDKDFDGWNVRKKEIQATEFTTFANEREIWWCALGVNIGDEEDGKNSLFERPVLILKKFNRQIVLVVPLTTKPKPNRYYFQLQHGHEPSAVILSQLRLISTKRLTRRIKIIGKKQFEEIKTQVANVAL